MPSFINAENLCMGCMSVLDSPNSVCRKCGFDINAYEQNMHQLRPNTILNGKYLAGRVLGEGGFGITYLGWDLNLDIRVAIKEYYPAGLVTREITSTGISTVMPFSGDKGEFYRSGLDKFVNEAKSLAKFYTLPGIVAVKDFFRENGTAYIVMEFVDGVTLKQYLDKKGGRLRPEEVLALMRPVMRSLQEIHSFGIIHRDISPDNIMLTGKGDIKLLDFGAAREFIGDGNKSKSVFLKPGYAPEEQYRTKGHQGPWTDVYALCATMYRMMTGKTPPESLERLNEEELIPPSGLGIRISGQVESALLKGLAIFQKNRYKQLDELYYGIYGEPMHERPEPVYRDEMPKQEELKQEPPRQEVSEEQEYYQEASAGDFDVNGAAGSMQQNIGEAYGTGGYEAAVPKVRRRLNLSTEKKGLIVMLALNLICLLIGPSRFILSETVGALVLNMFFIGLFLLKKGREGNVQRLLLLIVQSIMVFYIAYVYSNYGSYFYWVLSKADLLTSIPPIFALILSSIYTLVGMIRYSKEQSDSNKGGKRGMAIVAAGVAIFLLSAAFSTARLIPVLKQEPNANTGATASSSETVAPSSEVEETPSAAQAGNSSNNIINGGIAAQQGDWIYYKNGSDNGYLYKVNSDGTGNQKVAQDSAFFISVVDDWVYYCNNSDNSAIYRVRTDGTERTKLSSDNSFDINVFGDWIYYGNGDDKNSLYKIRLDGTERTQIADEPVSFVNISGDWIYYTNDEEYIYKIRTDGTERTRFLENRASDVYVNGGWIYYDNMSDETFYKVRSDGTESTAVAKLPMGYVSITEGWIYYCVFDVSGISKVRHDGTFENKLCNDKATYMVLFGDWIYYENADDNHSLYKINIDGTGRQKIG